MSIVRPGRSVSWTRERINALTTPDVRQLRANAERLSAPEVMELCDAVLGERRKRGAAGAKPKAGARLTAEKKGTQPGGSA
jgi:hypothetical protein